MTKKQVLLLINDFYAYYVKLNLFHKQYLQDLSKTKVVFLSFNITFVCQILDQKIIKAWKAYTRKKWLYFFCIKYVKNKDFFNITNIFQAIC